MAPQTTLVASPTLAPEEEATAAAVPHLPTFPLEDGPYCRQIELDAAGGLTVETVGLRFVGMGRERAEMYDAKTGGRLLTPEELKVYLETQAHVRRPWPLLGRKRSDGWPNWRPGCERCRHSLRPGRNRQRRSRRKTTAGMRLGEPDNFAICVGNQVPRRGR